MIVKTDVCGHWSNLAKHLSSIKDNEQVSMSHMQHIGAFTAREALKDLHSIGKAYAERPLMHVLHTP